MDWNSSQTRSTSYRLAYQDTEFILRGELRPAQLQLELLRPELVQHELGIEFTVVIFGNYRLPNPESARLAGARLALANRRKPIFSPVSTSSLVSLDRGVRIGGESLLASLTSFDAHFAYFSDAQHKKWILWDSRRA